MIETFIEDNLKIMDLPSGEYIPFPLLKHQKDVLMNLKTKRFNLIRKYRQAGITQLVSAYLVTKGVMSPPDKPDIITIISPNFKSSSLILYNISNFIKQIPRAFWGSDYYGSEENLNREIMKYKEGGFELPNGSTYIIGTTIDFLKGYNPTCVFLDEAAYFSEGEKFYESIIPLFSNLDTEVIMASTPNGTDELFFKAYVGSVIGKNPFNLINLNWWDDIRLNNDDDPIKWVLFDSNNNMIDILENVEMGHKELVRIGYVPINEWYHRINSHYDDDSFAQEVESEFVF